MAMWARIDGLRVLELGGPGDFRDRLTALVLAGKKQATAGLLELDYAAEQEELEHPGEHLVLVDSDGARLAEVEITSVEVLPFAQVPWEFADAEGEGFRSIEDWRQGHQRFWARSDGVRVDDRTQIVCLRFLLVSRTTAV